MSRLPAAIIVCGVCFVALSPSGHAFPVGTLSVFDAPRPVLLTAHENKRPHGDADLAQTLGQRAKDLAKHAKELEQRARELEKLAKELEKLAKEKSAAVKSSTEEKSGGVTDKDAAAADKDTKDTANKSADKSQSDILGADRAEPAISSGEDGQMPGKPSAEKPKSGTAAIAQDKLPPVPAKKPAGRAVPLSTLENRPVTHSRPPGLPVRKPRKPVIRTSTDTNKAGQQSAPSRSARQNELCTALQACRNEFSSCKSKIKDPDQSEAWSIAKEECGASYKVCVEKDFRSGEWFFTRWFYFQELNCK